MSESLPRLQREVLEEKLAELSEEYKAVHRQLGHTLDEVERIRLERRSAFLEQQIREVDAKRAQLLSAPGRGPIVVGSSGTSSSSIATVVAGLIGIVCVAAVIVGVILLARDRETNLPPVEAILIPSDTALEAITVPTSPDQAVRDYYQLINERQYAVTWSLLDDRFKRVFSNNDFSDYVEWWDSVEVMEVGQATLQMRSEGEAVVTAEMAYHMKTGNTVNERQEITLVYNDARDVWLFHDSQFK